MMVKGFLKATLLCYCLGLASCGVLERNLHTAPDLRHQSIIQADTGEDVVRHLTARYSDTRANCGSDTKPAFLCNGVLIRGTSSNPTYHVWDNSPASIEKGGVSVSYLRTDSAFNKLALGYNNGYILTAYDFAAAKIHPEILCFFPIDGATVHRDNKGCGTYSGFSASGPCHLQGIVTADQWWSHYNSNSTDRRLKQCGLDVSDERNSLAGPAFMAGIGGMRLMGNESFAVPNELILTAWGNGLGKSLPLEAFFYLEGSSGLVVAQRNQRDLQTTDGIHIPIISIKLPQAKGQAAAFYYRATDQTGRDSGLDALDPTEL